MRKRRLECCKIGKRDKTSRSWLRCWFLSFSLLTLQWRWWWSSKYRDDDNEGWRQHQSCSHQLFTYICFTCVVRYYKKIWARFQFSSCKIFFIRLILTMKRVRLFVVLKIAMLSHIFWDDLYLTLTRKICSFSLSIFHTFSLIRLLTKQSRIKE